MSSKKTDFFALLEAAAMNGLEAAKLFQEAMSGHKAPSSYGDQLKQLETKGDDITHSIYKGLNKVFITPIDREDIMELAIHVDDVIDGIEASIARFDYLNITHTDDSMRSFAAMIVESCECIVAAFQLLSKKKYLPITEHTRQINALENESDKLMRESIRAIFTQKQDPYHDFKMKELYERLEETTDACEDVANVLDSIVLKYA